MKKRKILKTVLSASLISALLFTACSSPAGGGSNNETNNNGGSGAGSSNNPDNSDNADGDKITPSVLSEKFKFNFSDAKVLLGLKDGDNSIYKITSTGELVSAFSWDGIIEDSDDVKTIPINNIYKSPKSDDVIIQINGFVLKTDYTTYKSEYVGPLIHVDKNNKVTSPSVLEENIPELNKTLSIPHQETDSVKFDDNGIAYFIAYNGFLYDSDSSKYALFSYNPKTKVRKQLLPYQTELMYKEFYVTNDGKCVILKEKSKTGESYSISAVSVNNPSTKATILTSGTDDIASITYDANTDALYLNVRRQKTRSSDISVYYKCSRNGDIFNAAEEFLTSPEINIPQVFEREYIDCGEWPPLYKDRNSDQFKPEEFLNYLFQEFSWFAGFNSEIKPSTNDYYISFEKFKDIEEFKPIYEATKDKTNEEAIAALDTGNIKKILMEAYLKNGRYAKIENCTETSDLPINNSLLADTLYNKTTRKLVAENEEESAKIFKYCTCGKKHYIVSSNSKQRYIELNTRNYPKPLPEYMNSDGSINYTKILEAFFNSANVHGKKEFSLEYFKNCTKENFPTSFVYDKDLTNYKKILASDKKNEEALQFIYADIERACLFEEYLQNTTGGVKDGKRCGKLFVIEGTNTPAFNVSFAKGQGFKYDYFPLISVASGLWALNSNDYKIYPTTVHVMDSDGCILNHRSEEYLQIKDYGNGYYLEKYFVDNTDCYMHISKGYYSVASDKDIIYSVNFDEDKYEDLLINVPGSDDMNIKSWIVTNGKLYLSGENNVTKEVINGYVDILTKAYTPITEIKDSTVCLSRY